MFRRRNIKFVRKTSILGNDSRSYKGSQIGAHSYCQEMNLIKLLAPKLASYDHDCLCSIVLCKQQSTGYLLRRYSGLPKEGMQIETKCTEFGV